MEEEHRLKLVGYYPSANHGFMMPLFGRSQGANSLFLARCSGTGGRYGTVTAFEPVEVDNQRRLPPDEVIEIEIGQGWRDVFLWNDAVFVGTPRQLWSELASFHADLEARAPLSLIDLAVQARRPEAERLAPVAMNFLTERHGESQADGWRRQFLRLHLELVLRENLSGATLTEAEFRLVTLSEQSGELRLELPSSLAAALETSGRGQRSVEDLVRLAAMLGTTLVVPAATGSAEEQSGEAASAEPQPSTEGSPSFPEQRDVPPPALGSERHESRHSGAVAIWGLGARASAVTGHLRSARNRDAWPGADRLDLLTDQDVLTGDRRYQILIVVIDDDYLEDGSPHPGIEEFLADQVSEGTLVLIAPALPSDGPSILLQADQDHQLADRSLAHAIVDTAIARSPFWWGEAKRSFDRRITDVVQLAITAGGNPALRRELMQRGDSDILPVLSVGLLPAKPGKNDLIDGPGNLRLGSESSWVDGNPKRNDPDILFSIRMSSEGRDREPHDERLIAEGRRPTERFSEFAARSLTPLTQKGRRGRSSKSLNRVEQLSNPPSDLAPYMHSPTHAAAFAIEREMAEDGQLKMVVTAERPSLDLIERANRLGWSVVRYTDTTSVRRLVQKEPASESFPDEVDIGPIRSTETHRRLATRGVDQRDVFRVRADVVAEALRPLTPEERAIGTEEARLRRSASGSFNGPTHEYLFRAEFLQSAHPAAERLREVTSISTTRGGQRQTRRHADMQRCWSPPADGLHRYALVDGAVPPILVRLQEDEVPVEDFFVIDGDSAVSALFRSRAFAVWARATLPAASSWMARFSLINTFGGFPIVHPFLLDTDVQGRTILRLESPSSPIIELAAAVESHIERVTSSEAPSSWKEAHAAGYDLPAMQRLDEIVLNAYGLAGNAGDTTILRRLLVLNGQLD